MISASRDRLGLDKARPRVARLSTSIACVTDFDKPRYSEDT